MGSAWANKSKPRTMQLRNHEWRVHLPVSSGARHGGEAGSARLGCDLGQGIASGEQSSMPPWEEYYSGLTQVGRQQIVGPLGVKIDAHDQKK